MSDFEKIYAFDNLYKAYRAARLGKRGTREEILFEADLSRNLIMLSESIRTGTYKIAGYYSFMIHDPKDRKIHALHFADRVVQHSLCDNVIAPLLEKRLIYENAACRLNKGTDFARNILTQNLSRCFRKAGKNFWILKCDIRKYFDSIDHEILKKKLRRAFAEPNIQNMLEMIIDSYETAPGRGVPLGNQTSQWFGLYYLDGFDRLFKEKFRLTMYVRYMDDVIVMSEDRKLLEEALLSAEEYTRSIGLSFNGKTQLFPAKNGVAFLGWHFYLTNSGKIEKRLNMGTKRRFFRAVKKINYVYNSGLMQWEEAQCVLQSYCAYLKKGTSMGIKQKGLRSLVLMRND